MNNNNYNNQKIKLMKKIYKMIYQIYNLMKMIFKMKWMSY